MHVTLLQIVISPCKPITRIGQISKGICSLPHLSCFSQFRLGMNESHCLMASQILWKTATAKMSSLTGVIQSRHLPQPSPSTGLQLGSTLFSL